MNSTTNNCETCVRLIKKRGISNPVKLALKYCNKCKEQDKLMRLKACIDELKEKVKVDPDAIFNTHTDYWSEQAIKVVASAKPDVAMQLYKLYPNTRCYIAHSKEKQESILNFLNDCYIPILNAQRIARAMEQKKTVITRARQIPIWAQYGFHFLGVNCDNYKPCVDDLTYSDFMELVGMEPGVLEFVPESWRTYELCIRAMACASENAVKIYHMNGEAFPLIHVPLKHRDEQMCLTAAAWCNRALWFFPPNMRTLDIYIKCARINPSTVTTTMPEPYCQHPDVLKAKCDALKQECVCL